MGLETVTNIADLVATNPPDIDPKSQGAAHLRNIKIALLNDFAGFAGAVAVAGVDAGVVNAYTLTPANALVAYAAKMSAIFIPNANNTGAATLNISGLGAKTIKRVDGADLAQNDLLAGVPYAVIYDGTLFKLAYPTKNYVDQLAFNTVLPAQSGNAGKALTTNGSVASWAYTNISTILATVTTSATLSGTYLHVPVAMTAMGQSIRLPPANTLSVGGPQYIIDNTKGAYPVGIRDNNNLLLISVAPGGEALGSLRDNTTVGGMWSITGNSLEPGMITIDTILSTTFLSTLYPPFVALDANTSIHFAAIASGFAAFVVDNTGKVVSAPVTVSASAGMVPKMAFPITSTTAIVFYTDGTTYAAVVLSLTGSSPTLSLSVGTPATTASKFFTFEDGQTPFQNLVQLDSTHFLGVTANTTATGPTFAVAVQVTAGITITIGTPVTIIAGADNSTLGQIYVFPLTATTAIAIYPNGTSTNISSVILSVAGTSVSVATAVQAPAGFNNSSNYSWVLLSPNKAMGVNSAAGSLAQAIVITIAGTTVAWSSPVGFGPSNTFNTGFGNVDGVTQYNQHLTAISSTVCYAWAVANNTTVGQSMLVALTESGGNVSAGTPLLSSFSQAASGADGYGVGLDGATGTNEFLAVQQAGAAAYHTVRAIPHKITAGGVASAGNAISLSQDLGTVANINTLAAARMSNGDYAIVGDTFNQYIPVLRSNGDTINFRGRISCPLASVTQPIPMVIGGNRLVYQFAAVATTAAAPGTKQMRIINVEIAA